MIDPPDQGPAAGAGRPTAAVGLEVEGTLRSHVRGRRRMLDAHVMGRIAPAIGT